jgi:hypothetical protein
MCQQPVNNNYNALIEQIRSSDSSNRAIFSVEERGHRTDLEVCDEMAKLEHFLVLEKSYPRLNRVLDIFRQSGVVPEQQRKPAHSSFVGVLSVNEKYLNTR